MDKEKSFTIPHFPHDISASNDPKLVSLRMAFGWAGVGMFWAIIEALHREPDGMMDASHLTAMIKDFWLQEQARTSSPQFENAEPFEKFLYANALLSLSDRYATSNRVAENLLKIREKSEKARASALSKYGSNKPQNANAVRTQSERYARREEKIKEEKSTPLHPPKGEAEPTERSIQLAQGLLDCILFNNPNYKHTKDTVKSWSRVFDLMVRVDKRNDLEIEQVIKFSQKDSFWRENILSAGKLREKYDQLWLKAKGREDQKPQVFVA